MSYSDPLKLFKIMREKAQERANSSGVFGNPNLIKLQKGKSYAVRLLWLPSEKRESPMINQYVHHYWDENAIGSKDVSVICPTSQYDLGDTREGFDSCPVCAKASYYYKQSQNGSEVYRESYNRFKRTLKGYVPVYVVNGPEEDKHKIRIMPYTISFKKYFDEKIFGIKKQDKNSENDDLNEDNMIGIDAFMYYDPKKDEVITKGHNFLITVDTKKVPIGARTVEMPDYKIEFSMKSTDISDFDGKEITPEYFKSLSEKLHFDEDFYKFSDVNQLNKFIESYDNSCSKTTSDNENIVNTVTPFDNDDERVKPNKKNNVETEDDEISEFVSSSKQTDTKVVEEDSNLDLMDDSDDSDDSEDSEDSDEIDVDELLSDLV